MGKGFEGGKASEKKEGGVLEEGWEGKKGRWEGKGKKEREEDVGGIASAY